METKSVDVVEFAKLDVLERLEKIETTLKEQDPQLPIHLQQIHKTLSTYEELIHILPDEKIAVLMAGMAKYRKINLIQEATTSKRKTALSKTTVDDI